MILNISLVKQSLQHVSEIAPGCLILAWLMSRTCPKHTTVVDSTETNLVIVNVG